MSKGNRTLTANKDLRDFMENHNIKVWQLAESIGMSDSNLYTKLRHELSDTVKDQYMEHVKQIIERRSDGK